MNLDARPHDAFLVDPAGEFFNAGGFRSPRRWNLPIPRNFRKREENECAFSQARMRHDQAGLLDDEGTIQQQVKIEGSRSVARSARTAS